MRNVRGTVHTWKTRDARTRQLGSAVGRRGVSCRLTSNIIRFEQPCKRQYRLHSSRWQAWQIEASIVVRALQWLSCIACVAEATRSCATTNETMRHAQLHLDMQDHTPPAARSQILLRPLARPLTHCSSRMRQTLGQQPHRHANYVDYSWQEPGCTHLEGIGSPMKLHTLDDTSCCCATWSRL